MMSDARDAQFRSLYKELRIADQEHFYSDRSEEYEQAHRQAITVRNILLILAAVAGVVAQAVSGTSRASLGVVAAVLAALAGALTGFEALIGFAQLHKLYNDASLNLAKVALDWDAAEPGSGLSAGIEGVEKIFQTENGQWGRLAIKPITESAAAGDGADG